MVADRMQLRGAATIHTYVQKDYGDVMFIDVYPFADLSPGSLLVHQARFKSFVPPSRQFQALYLTPAPLSSNVYHLETLSHLV